MEQKSNRLLKRIAILFFLGIAFLRITIPILQNQKQYLEKYDPHLYEQKYNASQYMIPASKNPISDEQLLSHAGYKYATGTNPILINSDHPPLGKYLIGWSILIFRNNRIISIVCALSILLLVGTITYMLTLSLFFSTLAVCLASFDPMLVDQVIHAPILDIIQATFFLLYLLFLCFYLKSPNNILLLIMGITLGALSSIKLYFPAIIAVVVTITTFIITKKDIRTIMKFALIIPPFAFITYALTYLRYFIISKSIMGFMGVQKWMFLFWQNNSIDRTKIFANILPLILFNKWKVWWGNKEYISYSGWSIVWPIFFILSIIAAGFCLYQYITRFRHVTKIPYTITIMIFLSLWFIVFTGYLCFVPISPRYLMMLYLPSYILIVLSLHKFSHEKKRKNHI